MSERTIAIWSFRPACCAQRLSKGRQPVACLPDPRLNDGVQTQHDLPNAGFSDIEQRGLEARLTTPADVLPSILQMLIADRFRYIVAESGPPKRGSQPIIRYSFEKDIRDDDLPPDQ